MRDIPEFAHLKSFEAIFKTLEGDQMRKVISKDQFKIYCAPYHFTEEQKGLLEVILREKGYEIG